MPNGYPEHRQNPSSLSVLPGEYILKFTGIRKCGFWIFSSYTWFFEIMYGPGAGQTITGTTGARYREGSKLVRWTFATSRTQYTTPPIFKVGALVRACIEEDLLGRTYVIAVNPML
jgi:hypothetical protein